MGAADDGTKGGVGSGEGGWVERGNRGRGAFCEGGGERSRVGDYRGGGCRSSQGSFMF